MLKQFPSRYHKEIEGLSAIDAPPAQPTTNYNQRNPVIIGGAFVRPSHQKQESDHSDDLNELNTGINNAHNKPKNTN